MTTSSEVRPVDAVSLIFPEYVQSERLREFVRSAVVLASLMLSNGVMVLRKNIPVCAIIWSKKVPIFV